MTSIVTGAEEKAMRQLAAQLCIELVETQLPALDFKQHVTGSILEDVVRRGVLETGLGKREWSGCPRHRVTASL